MKRYCEWYACLSCGSCALSVWNCVEKRTFFIFVFRFFWIDSQNIRGAYIFRSDLMKWPWCKKNKFKKNLQVLLNRFNLFSWIFYFDHAHFLSHAQFVRESDDHLNDPRIHACVPVYFKNKRETCKFSVTKSTRIVQIVQFLRCCFFDCCFRVWWIYTFQIIQSAHERSAKSCNCVDEFQVGFECDADIFYVNDIRIW